MSTPRGAGGKRTEKTSEDRELTGVTDMKQGRRAAGGIKHQEAEKV